MSHACPACLTPTGAGEAFCGECGTALAPAARPATQSPAQSPARLAASTGVKAAAAEGVLFAVPGEMLQHASGPRLRRALEARAGGGGVIAVPAGRELDAVQDALAALSAGSGHPRIDALCLLGTPALMPHAAVENAVGREAVLTDHFYGRLDVPDAAARGAGDLLPLVPVSRLPFDDADALLALLARPPQLHASWEGAALVSCEVWEGASAAVIEQLGVHEPLHLSPPAGETALREQLGARPGRLYFNVHGAPEEALWVGQGHEGEWPEVVRCGTIDVGPGAVVVSEACYGGACFPDEEAISQAFLARGAGAFYGSTIVAWGPPTAPPGLADLIPIHVFAGLDAGLPAGRALLEAKARICHDYLERDGLLTPQAHNTLLSFCHYGLPGCRVSAMPAVPAIPATPAASGRPAPTAPGGPPPGKGGASLLGALRSGAAGASARGSVLGRVRGTLGERADSQGWGVDAFVRGPLEDIARTLGPLAHLLERARDPRRAAPREGVLVAYRGRLGRRLTLVVEDADPRGGARGLVADGQGKVLEEFVTRGARPPGGRGTRRWRHP